jgi:hypothetical protein
VSDISFDDLIQAKLDGTASPQESQRLEGLLQSDPRVRARHDELAAVFTALAGRTLEAPPAGLTNDILRAVRLTGEADRRAPRTAARSAFSWFRFALPTAAVFAALMLVWATLRHPSTTPADAPAMSGSIASLDAPKRHLQISHDTSVLDVTAQGSGPGQATIELRNGGTSVQVTLLAAPGVAELASVPGADAGTRIDGPDGAGLRFALAPGARVSVTSKALSATPALRVILTSPDGTDTPARLELGSPDKH